MSPKQKVPLAGSRSACLHLPLFHAIVESQIIGAGSESLDSSPHKDQQLQNFLQV